MEIYIPIDHSADVARVSQKPGPARVAARFSEKALELQVKTDDPLSRAYDRVMPLFADESLYLCGMLPNCRDATVLDLGSGSGVFCLCAASRGARRCTGIDMNARALDLAVENARINGLAERCNFILGDLYEPLGDRVFDLALVNPPFVPLPFGTKLFLSADGGPDGLRVIRRVLAGLDGHLSVNGCLLLLTMSLGDGEEPLMYRLIREILGQGNFEVTTTHVYEEKRILADSFFEIFRAAPHYYAWRRYLRDCSLTHLYYMLHEVSRAEHFSHIERQNPARLDSSFLSGSWEARLERYRRWFDRDSE